MRMSTPEEQLDEDMGTVKKKRDEISSMEKKRLWFGGGKKHSGILGLGVSDKNYDEAKKEANEYEGMAKQQYLLGKRHSEHR